MSVIHSDDYKAPPVLNNRHAQTIYPALLRKVKKPRYQRERLATDDGDFLDLDWVRNGADHLVIICHGLEGNSSRAYVTGMVNVFVEDGLDVLALNYRGCSEEMNKKPYSYHSGATNDLERVVIHATSKGYEKVSLVGFSLGGNLVLKYLGEETTDKPNQIQSAVAFSVPLDLLDCAIQIHRPSNFLYEQRFLRSFRKKVNEKSRHFREIDPSFLEQVKSVYDFDDYFTAPMGGFKSAIDYYRKCSAIRFVAGIKVPTLVVNAINDPFLGPKCFETKEFKHLKWVTFELTKMGGHCGFPSLREKSYWSERRAIAFIASS